MTKREAIDMIQDTFDDEFLPEALVEELFQALYERTPDDDERTVLWWLCCAATPGLCGCSKRREHEQGACLDIEAEGYIGEQFWRFASRHGINWAIPIGWPNNQEAICEEEDPQSYDKLWRRLVE